MLETLITVWVIGMIATLLVSGYLGQKYNLVLQPYKMLICLPFWPLFVLVGLGGAVVRPKKKVIGRR